MPNDLVSIIIPVKYRADLTRVCIDSIINYTKIPYELILVQEGENKEITDLLISYKTRFIHNKIPKGFAGAMNSGLDIAYGNYFCFLNNDTVVTPGWLEEMMSAFQDKKVGLVSPTYSELPFERRTKDEISNKSERFEYIDDPLSFKGVCFLVKKEVIDKIGKWDESLGLGGGDDNDLCFRIKKAGYEMVIARKSFIYHYGSASFRKEFNNDEEYARKYSVKQFNKFREKHNLKEKKPKVFISIPCVDGQVNYRLAIRLIEWSHDPEIQVKIQFYPNLVPLDNARNKAVKEFLEDYYDYFMHIDDNIIPPPNALREMLEADKDIIAPLCFTMKQDDEGFWFPLIVAHRYNKDGKYEPYYGKGIEETDIVTGGCHLVKREVMEKLERPYYFTYHKNGLVEYSEDFVFSQQCQKLGYKMFTHYGLHCRHIKLVDIKDINDFLVRYK